MAVGDTYILDEKQGKSLNRIDTKTNWEAVNPVLAIGEMGIEKDGLLQNIKVGDGVTPWNSLQYMFKSCPYEVGDILVTMNATDPALRWPGTTWEVFAPGRVLIGAGTGTDINGTSMSFAVGATGGEYSHQLTVGELAGHTHTRGTMNITGTITERPCSSSMEVLAGKSGAFSTAYEGDTVQWGATIQTSGSSTHKNNLHNFDASKSWTGATSSTGDSGKHNTVPAYVACYAYKRTA